MENQYDIIVVGAGVLGASSAFHLKRNNPTKNILLVDRYPSHSQGNTGRSNAMFRNTFTSYDNRTLSDSSIDFYIGLQKSGVDIEIRQTGYLWLLSESQLSSSERYVRKMLDSEMQVRRYDSAEIKKLLPTLRTSFENSEEAALMNLKKVDGAIFGGKCGQLDPILLTGYYVEQFRKMGGKVAFNTGVEKLLISPVESLGIEGEPFVWQESKIVGIRTIGSITADIISETIVLAAGAWNNELLEPLGIDGHVKAKKRQLFKIQAANDLSLLHLIRVEGFNALCTLPFVIFPTSGCFLKAIAASNEFWAGCDDNFNREYIVIPSHNLDDFKAEPEYYENNVNRILKEYFTEFKDKKPSKMWAGLYSYNTIDYLPFVFSERGAIIVGGDSGSGIMKGDSLGRIVESVYRESESAELFGGKPYLCSNLGFEHRSVEREEWVI